MSTTPQDPSAHSEQAPGSTWSSGGYPPGQQGYVPSQQPYGSYVPQPPKEKHTLRNVLLIIIAVCVLGMAGCGALVIGGASKVANDMEKSDNAPGGAKNPLAITAGQPFEVSGFNYAGGWTVGEDGIGGTTLKNLKVTNNRDERDSALVEIKFMKGTEVLGSSDCTTDPIQVGQTVTLNCLGTQGKVAGYDKITINDTF